MLIHSKYPDLSEVIDKLASLLPNFRLDKEYESDKNGAERLAYLEAGQVAGHIAQLKIEDRTEDLTPFFNQIEVYLSEEDDQLENLIVVGFIESLQNHLFGDEKSLSSKPKLPLGPKTKEAWDKVDRFWDGIG